MPSDTDPAAADLFDQRHLIELYTRGLITELPYELGPMPIVESNTPIGDDLTRWGVVDATTGQLTAPAAELFAGITSYEWAIWGIVLLYNQRERITAELPDELVNYGVHHAIRDIPRVTFLIGVHGNTVTSMTLAGGRLATASEPVRGPGAAVYDQVGRIVLAILDPDRKWKPYPLTEVAIPAAAAAALKQRRTSDADRLYMVMTDTSEGLYDAGVSLPTVKAITDLLKQDNVASAQVCLTRRTPVGKKTARNNAAGVLFFRGDTNDKNAKDKEGVVVSYPTRALDQRQWITYEPANGDSMARAIAALHAGLDRADAADITTA